jgi:hypothetical protein
MKLDLVLQLYNIIASGIKDISSRQYSIKNRQIILNSFYTYGFKKNAFDTRRINQGTEIIPRRGLQNYHRSENFLSKAIQTRLVNLSKIRNALYNLKNKYGNNPEWHDSNARILLSTIEKGLRLDHKDNDYTDVQPGVGNLDYIDQLLYVRYRLSFDNICNLQQLELENVILSKDEALTYIGVDQKVNVTAKTYDSLLEKLFEGCKASYENPNVERIITITINDKINKED